MMETPGHWWIIHVGEEVTTNEIVFAQDGYLQLLGARTLEGLNVKVDSRNKRLVASPHLLHLRG